MRNISGKQKELLDKLQKKTKDIEYRWNPVRGTFKKLAGPLHRIPTRAKPEEEIIRFINAYDILLGPNAIKSNYRIYNITKRQNGTVRYRINYSIHKLLVIDGLISVLVNGQDIVEVRSSLDRNIQVTGTQKITPKKLPKTLSKILRQSPGFLEFVERHREALPVLDYSHYKESTRMRKSTKRKEEYPFPLTSRPKLVLTRSTDGYHPAWSGYAFLPHDGAGLGSDAQIDNCHFLLDATTGKIIFREPTIEQAETAVDIQGVPVILPDGTPFSITVRGVEDGGNYYLKNIDESIDIITFNGNGSYDSTTLENALNNDTINTCEDTDDDFDNWTSSCNQDERDDSQQPEIDAHLKATVGYNYYLSTFGYKGFDNELYGAGTGCPVNIIVHTGLAAPGDVQGAAFVNYEDSTTNNRHGFIKIRDGRCDGGNLTYDFYAGDHCTFAHEYQHALTYFGVLKPNGDPAYLYGNTIFGAFREGISDSFGGFISGIWQLRPAFPDGVALGGADPLRTIEFPRDPDQIGGGAPGADHYDDIGAENNKYYKCTILGHLGFLLSSGGIHERPARGAQYIPIPPISSIKTAEIWFQALMDTFDTIDNAGGDERMIDACNLFLEKAEEIYGDTSKEYVLLRRAMYAVGVYPYDDTYTKQSYGGEACMIPWGNDWRRSQEYLPLDYARWKSLDLFIDNGDGPGYEAGIGQENNIYARVRNIGDQDLDNIRVEFYYRKYGSALPEEEKDWRRCKDETGNDCTLLINNLPAESTFFGDNDYTPDQAVNWYLDPNEVTDEVGHFCLRAVINVDDPTATNHQNDYTNRVQSNVKQVVVDNDSDADAEVYFMAANPESKKVIPLEIELKHTLPKGATLKPLLEHRKVNLKPGEERMLGYRFHVPARLRKQLSPPYDGELNGKAYGEVTGPIAGQLVQVNTYRGLIRGKLRARIGDIGTVVGTLEGRIDRKSRQVNGNACVMFTPTCPHIPPKRLVLGITAELNPKRRIEFTQLVNGNAVGGVTVEIRDK